MQMFEGDFSHWGECRGAKLRDPSGMSSGVAAVAARPVKAHMESKGFMTLIPDCLFIL